MRRIVGHARARVVGRRRVGRGYECWRRRRKEGGWRRPREQRLPGREDYWGGKGWVQCFGDCSRRRRARLAAGCAPRLHRERLRWSASEHKTKPREGGGGEERAIRMLRKPREGQGEVGHTRDRYYTPPSARVEEAGRVFVHSARGRRKRFRLFTCFGVAGMMGVRGC